MYNIYPAYYTKFSCTNKDCSDSCCRNWEIDIDNDTYEKYKNYSGELKEKLEQNIKTDGDGPHFVLNPDRRCPFLTDDNLCEIYTEMGKSALCQICSEHPRFYNTVGNITLAGVGLCCEAAATLILDSTKSDSLLCEENSDIGEVFATIGNRELVEGFLSTMDNAPMYADLWLSSNDMFSVDVMVPFIDFLLSLEQNSDSFAIILNSLKENLAAVISKRREFIKSYPDCRLEYRRLVNYFLYRHYLSCEEYEDIADGIDAATGFAALSLAVIHLLDTKHWLDNNSFTVADQVNICKLYSQEIEYSDSNTTALLDYALNI